MSFIKLGLAAQNFSIPRTWLRTQAEARMFSCLKIGPSYYFDEQQLGEELATLAAGGHLSSVIRMRIRNKIRNRITEKREPTKDEIMAEAAMKEALGIKT